MLLIVINLFIHILLFTIYLSFLVIINSILSARDSWVGRGRDPWEIVLPPLLEKILEETLHDSRRRLSEAHKTKACNGLHCLSAWLTNL